MHTVRAIETVSSSIAGKDEYFYYRLKEDTYDDAERLIVSVRNSHQAYPITYSFKALSDLEGTVYYVTGYEVTLLPSNMVVPLFG